MARKRSHAMATRRSSAATTDDEDDVFIYAMVGTEVPNMHFKIASILVEVELSEALS
jgi:hypothetical protein